MKYCPFSLSQDKIRLLCHVFSSGTSGSWKAEKECKKTSICQIFAPSKARSAPSGVLAASSDALCY